MVSAVITPLVEKLPCESVLPKLAELPAPLCCDVTATGLFGAAPMIESAKLSPA